jgi:hypothetical protein
MTISGSSITDTTAYLMSVPDASVGAQAASVDADLYFNGTSNALRSGITTGGIYVGGTSMTDNGTTGDIYSDKATLNIDAVTRVSSLTIATTTTASGVNMNINTASPYALRVSTSSFRIKNDIAPLSIYSSLSSVVPEEKLSETPAINYKDILQVSPVTFKSLIEDDDVTKVRVGLIAEDVESKIPELSTYNEDGSVAYFDVNGILACLLAVVQEQQARIEQLESSLNP